MSRFKLPHVEEPSLRIKALRYFMTIFCFFFIFFGIGLIACAAILTSLRPTECQFLGEFFTGVYLLLASGCATGFFSLVTCLYTQRSTTSRSFVSACNVVIIIIVLQIFAAIAAHLFYARASKGDLKSEMNITWQGYYKGKKSCVDQLQEEFECCGVLNHTEWFVLSGNVSVSSPFPSSCLCAPDSSKCTVRYNMTNPNLGSHFVYVHNSSCHNVVLNFLFDTLLIPRILGPVLSLVECLLVLATVYVLFHIDNRSMVGAYVVSTPKEESSAPAGLVPTELQERQSHSVGGQVARHESENSLSESRDETVTHI